MNETGVYDFKLEYTFAGNALAELDRQLALLLSTREGTMPLDREFGLNMDFVDMPPEVAKSLYTAEVTEKVAKFIPTVKVREITWDTGGWRGLRPVIVRHPRVPAGRRAISPHLRRKAPRARPA